MFRGCEGKLGFKKKNCLRTQLLSVCPVSRGHQIYGFDESFTLVKPKLVYVSLAFWRSQPFIFIIK